MLPPSLGQSPHLLDKLDAFYHAQEHKRTQTLRYLERATNSNAEETRGTDRKEEDKLVAVTRDALGDAGFELLSRRDLDLCDSLNAAYLLRLSILPDVGDLDPGIAREFYPERFHANGTVIDKDELLFDGRVLVYWRGYSQEITRGRLLLPKIDYLQASLVQRSAASLKLSLDKVENSIAQSIIKQIRTVKRKARKFVFVLADSVPVKKVAQAIRDFFADESDMGACILSDDDDDGNYSLKGSFKLGRYGGSKIRFVGSPNPSDALDPFTICEIDYDDPVPCPNAHDDYLRKLGRNSANDTLAAVVHDMYEEVNHQAFTCEYDQKMSKNNPGQDLPRMQLLERVTISNLVDVFTASGRRKLLKALFAESKLVEPRYEEVSITPWRLTDVYGLPSHER
jgi:hypothetical protein